MLEEVIYLHFPPTAQSCIHSDDIITVWQRSCSSVNQSRETKLAYNNLYSWPVVVDVLLSGHFSVHSSEHYVKEQCVQRLVEPSEKLCTTKNNDSVL